MTVESPLSAVQRLPGQPSPDSVPLQSGPGAKQRVLVTADRLFYSEGIRTVGVDRLIAESSVTKATFYKHFGAKDNLVLDYITRRFDEVRVENQALVSSSGGPTATLRAIVAAIVTRTQAPGFRGCPFINAAAEFSDPNHPVRIVVVQFRDWYTETLVDLFKEAGHAMPGDAADEFLALRDGAMVGGYAGDPIAATAALTRAADRLLAAV